MNMFGIKCAKFGNYSNNDHLKFPYNLSRKITRLRLWKSLFRAIERFGKVGQSQAPSRNTCSGKFGWVLRRVLPHSSLCYLLKPLDRPLPGVWGVAITPGHGAAVSYFTPFPPPPRRPNPTLIVLGLFNTWGRNSVCSARPWLCNLLLGSMH